MFDTVDRVGPLVNSAQARKRIGSALDAIDAAHDVLRRTSSDLVGNAFRVEAAERLETQDRTNRGLMYRVFGEITDPADEPGSVPPVRGMLWPRLRITPKETTRRFKLAARIRPRRSLTGPPLAPELPALAAAVAAGTVGEDHIRAMCAAVDVFALPRLPLGGGQRRAQAGAACGRSGRRRRHQARPADCRLPQSRRSFQRRRPGTPGGLASRLVV